MTRSLLTGGRRCLAIAATVVACGHQPLAETNEIYYDWDSRRVLCGAGLDPVSGNDMDSVLGGLERAAATGEVIVLYAHDPGDAEVYDRVEAVLKRAEQLRLETLTMPDLVARKERRAGVALGFDDAHVDSWHDARDLFARYRARVSFFVTRYGRMSEERRQKLRDLFGDGHAIEAHGVAHLNAVDQVEEHGLDAYLRDEAVPSITALRADGFDPVSFAYPFGARTSEIDDALLEHVDMLRSVTFTIDTELVSDPCPE